VDTYHTLLVGRSHGDDIQIDRGCQDMPGVVVCVVTTHFRPARCAVEIDLLRRGIKLKESIQQSQVTFKLDILGGWVSSIESGQVSAPTFSV
jgi:hypothetical protein